MTGDHEPPADGESSPSYEELKPARRCKRCYYIIENIESNVCPECGQAFDPADPQSYTYRPPFLFWTYWLPGLLLSAGVGAGLFLLLVPAFGWGGTAILAVPICTGAILGYGTSIPRSLQVLLFLVLIAMLLMTLYVASLAGMLCTVFLAIIMAFPLLFGMGCGLYLRHRMKSKQWFTQRDYLPILLMVFIPLLSAMIEGPAIRGRELESVQTSVILNGNLAEAWDAVVFYEEVNHEPPLLLRLLLPEPVRTTGNASDVGDIKVCVYKKGRLAKQVTQVEREKLLAFRVIVQDNIENRSHRLAGGSFAFEAIDANHTRVTLTTNYEPYMAPRFAWRWAERWSVHTLHGHVLRGMQLNVDDVRSNGI